MGVAVGIDLGTSNSCVAVVRNGEPIVLTDAEGRRTQPSVVAFGHGGHTLVGHRARKQLLYAPENTVISVKRLIGGRYSSPDVQRLKALAAYGIAEGEHDTVRVRVQGKLYTPEEISSRVLAHMKQIAEAALGEEVDKAVVTVPAYFNDAQRQATRDAASLAGLECLRILNEPTAAALAYGYQKGRRQHVVVYDLGGGTFDVSVLRIDEDFFEVVATAGDTFLGGDDFDEAVAEKFLEVLEKQLGHSVHENRSTRLRLREAAERAKIALCDEDSVRVEVPAAWRSPTGEELDFVGEIDRYHYAMTVMPLVKRTIEVCEMAMHTAALTPRQIDAVLLVGGMTRYPLVHDAVRQHFGLLPNNSVNPDEVVAIGAAIQAYTLTATDDVALDPAVLLDVTPRTLAVGTLGGLVEPLVKLNTPVPTEATKTFVTAHDGQTEVRVAVFQGESRRQYDNTLIGELVLDDIVPAPRGAVRVDVTFEIDVDGILRVRALDRSTGREQTIRIESAASMTPDEMERARARVGELHQALVTEE